MGRKVQRDARGKQQLHRGRRHVEEAQAMARGALRACCHGHRSLRRWVVVEMQVEVEVRKEEDGEQLPIAIGSTRPSRQQTVW